VLLVVDLKNVSHKILLLLVLTLAQINKSFLDECFHLFESPSHLVLEEYGLNELSILIKVARIELLLHSLFLRSF